MKRQKNDAADAEAICEAALRPTMRFVPVKSEETQGAAMVFRVRELLIRQRTQAINALRGHLTEFGLVVPKGAANVTRLVALIADPGSGLPPCGSRNSVSTSQKKTVSFSLWERLLGGIRPHSGSGPRRLEGRPSRFEGRIVEAGHAGGIQDQTFGFLQLADSCRK